MMFLIELLAAGWSRESDSDVSCIMIELKSCVKVILLVNFEVFVKVKTSAKSLFEVLNTNPWTSFKFFHRLKPF